MTGWVGAGMAVALAIGAASCESLSGPARALGSYELRSIAGESLPGVEIAYQYATVTVVSDTLRFASSGRGSHARHFTVAYGADPAGSQPAYYDSEFAYRIHGDRLEISYICPPEANCIPGPHLVGRIEAAGLVLEGPEGEHRYAAIR